MLLYITPLIFLQIHISASNLIERDSNFRNQRVDRKSILNKGVWIKNMKDEDKATSSFLFRGNSVDADNIVEGDFNAFSDGSMPNTHQISQYIERNKRSPAQSMKGAALSNNLQRAGDVNKSIADKSKLKANLKPSTVLNNYPYEVAILFRNNKETPLEAKNYSTYVINETLHSENQNQTVLPLAKAISNISTKIDNLVHDHTENYTSLPKRSMHNLENEIIEELNSTEYNIDHLRHIQTDRDALFKNNKIQLHNTHSNNKYEAKSSENKFNRPVSEKGLLKVLSMLTSTLKKIMKQHNDVKDINKKLNVMNEEFVKNIDIVSDKLQDFDMKYTNFINLDKRILALDEKLNNIEQQSKTNENLLTKSLIEFEIQQKNFLTQQRQFYNIQKLMLAQNERINLKQNVITKTQSEISHRQNNFARILKKAKQMLGDNKISSQKTIIISSQFDNNNTDPYVDENESKTYIKQTTTKPEAESVKINLFSVPTATRLENQDELLLSEKDQQPVDDLVYKYYFNNTFIDIMMKKFLSGFIHFGDSHKKLRNIKNKRREINEKTILFPVNKSDEFSESKGILRERRWIGHHARRKWPRGHKSKSKNEADNYSVEDEKKIAAKAINNDIDSQLTKILPIEVNDDQYKVNPFNMMATSFCKGIGQDKSTQILNWCIEKALRRLRNIANIDVAPLPPLVKKNTFVPVKELVYEITPAPIPTTTDIPSATTSPSPAPIVPPPSPDLVPAQSSQQSQPGLPQEGTLVTISPGMNTPMSTVVAQDSDTLSMFFPDNDELENNLKAYDLKPDTEGNVYFDGSLHASDMVKDNKYDNDESNILFGMESSSKIDNLDMDVADSDRLRRDFLSRSFISRMKYQSMLQKSKL